VQPNRSAGRRRSGISFEPYELDVMQRPPRAVDPPILDAFGVWRVVFVEIGAARPHFMGVLLDEIAGRVRRVRPSSRRQCAGDRSSVLSAQ
jgi:hypothetical protein